MPSSVFLAEMSSNPSPSTTTNPECQILALLATAVDTEIRVLQNLTAKSKLHDPPCFIRFFIHDFALERLTQITLQSFVKLLQHKTRLLKTKSYNNNLPLTCLPSASSKISVVLKAHQLHNPLKDIKMPKKLLLTHLFGMFCPPHVIVTTYFPGVAG